MISRYENRRIIEEKINKSRIEKVHHKLKLEIKEIVKEAFGWFDTYGYD